MLIVLCFTASAGVTAHRSTDSLIVSKIVVTGNELTKEYVILREMSLKVGEPLDTIAIERDKKQIYSLQLFNKVDIDYTEQENRATVFVSVSERWYVFPIPIIGFKYRDINKMYYGLSLLHQNFRGRNEKLAASAVFGYDGWFDLAYQNPKLTSDDDLFLRFEGGYHHVRNQNTSAGEYDQKVSSASLSFGERQGLYLTILGFAGFNLWQIGDPQPGRTVSPLGIDRFLTIGGMIQYDRRDIREYPTSGSFASISLVKYGLGESDVNLFRYGVDFRGYQPIGSGFSICERAFGSFLSGGLAPSYLHAYYGYFDRIRGYYSMIMEGEDILGGSLELRYPLFAPRYTTVAARYLPPEFSVWRYGMYAALFADGGTIWYRTDQVMSTPWYAGYGGGVHFLLPYSIVLRTEYAFNQHGNGQFVFGIGASF